MGSYSSPYNTRRDVTLTTTQPHIHMQLQDKEDNVLTTITHTTYMLVLFFDRQLSGLSPDMGVSL